MRRFKVAQRRLCRPQQAGMSKKDSIPTAGGFSVGPFEETEISDSFGGDTVPDEELEEEEEPEEEADYILRTADETSDVILDVEGREFHTNRAVLAHYSPVFQKMLFSDFKEKDERRIPLPGKEFKNMVAFFEALFPRSASSPCPVSDKNLIAVLTLADEYQVDQVKVVCQNYIGEQLAVYFYNFYKHYTSSSGGYKPPQPSSKSYGRPAALGSSGNNMQIYEGSMSGQTLDKPSLIDKLTLYLQACDRYTLPAHRDTLKLLLVNLVDHLDDVKKGRPHYESLSDSTRIELLESLCVKFCSNR